MTDRSVGCTTVRISHKFGAIWCYAHRKVLTFPTRLNQLAVSFLQCSAPSIALFSQTRPAALVSDLIIAAAPLREANQKRQGRRALSVCSLFTCVEKICPGDTLCHFHIAHNKSFVSKPIIYILRTHIIGVGQSRPNLRLIGTLFRWSFCRVVWTTD